MKVILQQDVKNLGKKGDLVNASDGYARNFLFPKGLAIEANSSAMNTLKTYTRAFTTSTGSRKRKTGSPTTDWRLISPGTSLTPS